MRRLLFFLFLTVPAFSMAESACEASKDSCELYLCKEKEMECGDSGYWLGYGYPYCEAFRQDEEKFAPVCQGWLREVRYCLQNQVRDFDRAASCSDLRRQALHGHISCYIETGFCQLPATEQLKVLWYLRGALSTLQTWREAYLLAVSCSKQN